MYAVAKLYVVTRDWAEFRNWQLADKEARKDAFYVRSQDDLRGRAKGTPVLFLGGYYLRPDLRRLCEVCADNGFVTTFESAFQKVT